MVRSDRRAEAAPTLCHRVTFPVWQDPAWFDRIAAPGATRISRSRLRPTRRVHESRSDVSPTERPPAYCEDQHNPGQRCRRRYRGKVKFE